ncbi:peptide-methionine (S)-S-oxide reductase [Brumimicrobium salinarum]|uniref:Peptide methionine sulfoxide reductase MsrA n=1 Tax=Brumimicrobium salinarum TaxID=2058658 RepID=A0A2I0R5V8_9FLAO|nr:peptide-methionine (S)-S-oxide reductase MsrA [Brumimicrobium salinarum]PKR81963.1 peptide-methionine (S)-S-oxide reductase [Brumimicrobium salinarum]
MKTTILFFSFLFAMSSCNSKSKLHDGSTVGLQTASTSNQNIKTNAVAYFASGCFWCVEAIFESVKGVGDVVSGYSGGKASTAKYDLVSAGRTNHAEAVMVPYDSTKIDYKTLLKVFFGSHDPTTLNQQGPDRGKQYRSSIFYQNKREQEEAQAYIKQLLKEGKFSKITTEVVPLKGFYAAEDYHQDYERNHPNNSYVKAVSVPRLNEFKSKHPELLK